MKISLVLTIAATAPLLLGSCMLRKSAAVPAGSNPASATTVVTVPAGQVAPALLGQWSIIDVGSTAVTPVDDVYPSLTFDTTDCPAGQVNMYGYNGCNYINGRFAVKGNSLTPMGDFPTTMKYCADAVNEIAINLAIGKTVAFAIEKLNNEYFLYLRDAAGSTLMTLRKHNLNFFDGAWRVTNIQGVTLSTARAPEIVIDLANGKIHGNAGCNVVNGTVTQNMDREGGIGFTNLYATRMTCPDIAIEQAFLIALEQIETCVPGENDDIALLKDAAGTTVITLARVK